VIPTLKLFRNAQFFRRHRNTFISGFNSLFGRVRAERERQRSRMRRILFNRRPPWDALEDLRLKLRGDPKKRHRLSRVAYLTLLALVPLEIAHAIAAENPDSKAPSRIREMAGTWNVEEWMWTGPGSAPMALPAAVSHRYCASDADGALTLYGSIFVAPQWGRASNAPFRYRIVVGAVERARQTVELFLTPLSNEFAAEFLAFKYLYTHRQETEDSEVPSEDFSCHAATSPVCGSLCPRAPSQAGIEQGWGRSRSQR
jgi:hypothetical protein